MERFYLRVIADTHITVYHRATHQLIEFLPSDDKKACIKRILELIHMPIEEFYKYLFTLRIIPKKRLIDEKDKEKEDWYKGAWKSHTERYFRDNKITEKIPEEEIPYDLISELATKGKKGWNFGVKKTQEEPKKEIKKLPTKKIVKSPLELLEEEFKRGEMSIKDYIKKKKALK